MSSRSVSSTRPSWSCFVLEAMPRILRVGMLTGGRLDSLRRKLVTFPASRTCFSYRTAPVHSAHRLGLLLFSLRSVPALDDFYGGAPGRRCNIFHGFQAAICATPRCAVRDERSKRRIKRKHICCYCRTAFQKRSHQRPIIEGCVVYIHLQSIPPRAPSA